VLPRLAPLTAHAFAHPGDALHTGVAPVTGAAATLLTTFAIAGLGHDRWPIRALVRHPSDRTQVGRLLPFVLVVPFVAPLAVALARALGLGERPTIVLATLLPMLGLVGLSTITFLGHHRLKGEIETRDQQLLTILDGLPLAVMLRAPDGTLLHANPGAEAFVARLGVGVDAIHGSASDLMAHVEVVDEDERPYDRERLPVVSAIRDGRSHDATVGHGLPEGGYAWYSVRAAPTPLADGSTGTIVTLDDITEQQDARLRITVAERSSRLTFEHAPIGVAVLAPSGELLRANSALCDLLGYPDHEHLVTAGIGAALLAEDHEDPSRDLLAGLPDGRARVRVERQLPHHDGHRLPTELSIALVRDDQDRPLHLIIQVVDLSERRALEAELRAAASHDPLTGLVNRRALAERLQVAQARRERDGTDIGLLFIDLDRFKTINDSYGHETGDRLLMEMGRGLLTATRRSDTVCRMGGDEFVILCTPIDGTAGLQDVLDRVEVIQPAVEVAGSLVTVGHSVGAVLIGPDEDLDAALHRADAEMYVRKRASDDPVLEIVP
ncbi:MAG: diguanylate cyclase, partial [Nitriliruptor sp.]